MVQMQDEGRGAGSHKDELSFRNEYFSLHTTALFEVMRAGKVWRRLCWHLRNKLCWHDQEGTVHLEVQWRCCNTMYSIHLQAVLKVLNPRSWFMCQLWGPSTASASLTGKLPVGTEGRRGDQKRRQEVEEQEVRRDVQWSEDKRRMRSSRSSRSTSRTKRKPKKKTTKTARQHMMPWTTPQIRMVGSFRWKLP